MSVLPAVMLLCLFGPFTPAEAAHQPQNAGAPEPSQRVDAIDVSGTNLSKPHDSGDKKSMPPEHKIDSLPSGAGVGNGPVHGAGQGLSWIKQQPPASYTVQLMVAMSTKPLQDFAQKSLLEPYAIASFKRDGKTLYLLLHGSYATLAEAEGAAGRIEQETATQPWVRSFASLPELFDSSTPSPEVTAIAKRPAPSLLGAAWLWSRNPVHYTIQLRADRQIDSLRTFVEMHHPAGPLAVVRVRHMGKPWYLLLSGDYASEETTIAAIKALPDQMRISGPWQRRFASLQEQLVVANH